MRPTVLSAKLWQRPDTSAEVSVEDPDDCAWCIYVAENCRHDPGLAFVQIGEDLRRVEILSRAPLALFCQSVTEVEARAELLAADPSEVSLKL